jgi:hypothetical protein
MADSQHNVNPPQPPNYAGFGADGEALAAQDQQAGPSALSAASGVLFLLALIAVRVLDEIGVW